MKKRILLFILLIDLLTVFWGCGKTEMSERSFFALDTFCSVKTDAAHSNVLDEIESYVRSYDDTMTRYNEGSAIAILNRDRNAVNKDLAYVLTFIREHENETGGYFDPLMAALIDLWDFSNGGRIPADKDIKEALYAKEHSAVEIGENGTVSLKGRGGVDLGGILKGRILDGVTDICRKRGVKEAVINLGGDVALYSVKRRSWNVGVRSPDSEGLITWIVCYGKEIYAVTSGDYERYFESGGVRYHHILDPNTGYPSRGIRSLTVIAARGIEADLLSTAWFAMGSGFSEHVVGAGTGALAVMADGNMDHRNMEKRSDEKGRVFFRFGR